MTDLDQSMRAASSAVVGRGRLAAFWTVSTLLVAHTAPAITALTPLRRALWPSLAGIGDRRHVALTFDDGPDSSSTPAFLALLRRQRIHATFFLLGRMLQANPSVGREIATAGHEIAVHGWDHRPTPAYGPLAIYDRLARTCDLVADIAGTRPTWYRPPYGVLTAGALLAARRLDLAPVLWTCWGRDWRAGATPASVTHTVANRLHPGGTILLHDSDCTSAPGSWRNTLAALPDIISGANRQHLTIGPLAEHFAT